MKFNRVFIVCILLFLALVFVAEYRMPKKFRWEPSFGHADKQPFGCYVFDSVLKASLPQGYSVCRKTLYQLKVEAKQPMGILLVAETPTLTETDIEALFDLARRGSRIIISIGYAYGGLLPDTLHYFTDSRYVSQTLLQYAQQRRDRDTIVWEQDSLYGRREFLMYPQIVNNGIGFRDSVAPPRILARRSLHRTEGVYGTAENVAVAYTVGKGMIILTPTPLVFTNYTILDRDNRDYIFRLLSQFGSLPVVRTEAYLPVTLAEQQSPLRYFLSQRPLRWAVWLTVLALLLFMGFTARRRQRPIPVVKEPENKTLEFVQLIGTLYYQQHDYRDLVLKKFAYFSEELRRRQVPMDDCADLVERVRQLESDETRQLTAKEMTDYINEMNEILKNL